MLLYPQISIYMKYIYTILINKRIQKN